MILSREEVLTRLEPNPVLVKELRARFRSGRAFLVLSLFLLVLSVGALFMYATARTTAIEPGVGVRAFGASFARGIQLFQLALVTAIAPALTMNSISGERDRRTYELLLSTQLSGWAIVRGKLVAALAYVVLLVLGVLPILSLSFVFGGVSVKEVLTVQLSVLAYGVLFACVGLFWSTWLTTSAKAAVASYISVALISFMPLLLFWGFVIVWRLLMPMGDLGIRMLEKLYVVSLMLMPAITDTFLDAGIFGGAPQGPPGQNEWLRLLGLPLLASSILYLLAGMRVRPGGPRSRLLLIMLLWFAAVFVAWLWHVSSRGVGV